MSVQFLGSPLHSPGLEIELYAVSNCQIDYPKFRKMWMSIPSLVKIGTSVKEKFK